MSSGLFACCLQVQSHLAVAPNGADSGGGASQSGWGCSPGGLQSGANGKGGGAEGDSDPAAAEAEAIGGDPSHRAPRQQGRGKDRKDREALNSPTPQYLGVLFSHVYTINRH